MSAELVVRAEPEDVTFDRTRTAVLVVDMQNAFASAGGMLELAGVDVAPASEAVENTFLVCDAARRAGVPVVYLTIGYPPDLSTAGGADSPNPRKELALRLMNERPELRGRLLTFGTWDFEIVDRLEPQPGDVVIVKSRYSGFHGTELDSWLRSRGIRNLIVTGIASNVCVESTIRDAYFLEYWPLMVTDATMPAGSRAIHEATLFNVRTFFGWTAAAEDVASALAEVAAARP